MPLHYAKSIRMGNGKHTTAGLFLPSVPEHSKKPLLVLIHGSGVNAKYWDNASYSLPADFSTRGYSILNIQRSGYSGERCPKTKTPIADTVKLYAALISHTYKFYCVQKNGIILLGSGVGSLIGLAIAGWYMSPELPVLGVSASCWVPTLDGDERFAEEGIGGLLGWEGGEEGELRGVMGSGDAGMDGLESNGKGKMSDGSEKMSDVRSSEEESEDTPPPYKGKGKRMEMSADSKDTAEMAEEASQSVTSSSPRERVTSESPGKRRRHTSSADAATQEEPRFLQEISISPEEAISFPDIGAVSPDSNLFSELPFSQELVCARESTKSTLQETTSQSISYPMQSISLAQPSAPAPELPNSRKSLSASPRIGSPQEDEDEDFSSSLELEMVRKLNFFEELSVSSQTVDVEGNKYLGGYPDGEQNPDPTLEFLEAASEEELAEGNDPIWARRLKNEIAHRVKVPIQYLIYPSDVLHKPNLDAPKALSRMMTWFVNAPSIDACVLPMPSGGSLYEVESRDDRLLLQWKRDRFVRLVTQFSAKEIWWNRRFCTDLRGQPLWWRGKGFCD